MDVDAVKGSGGSIVAVLGFDERHVVRSILRLGFRNASSIHLILPDREEIDKRSAEAIERIRGLADAAGVGGVKVHRVNFESFDEAVLQIADILASVILGGSEAILSLGGGMRALVIEAYAASLSLPEELRKYLKIVIDFETGEGYAEIEPRIPSYRTLSEEEVLILREAERGEATPTKISEKLHIPKSSAWKKLAQMVEEGLLVKEVKGSYKPTRKATLLLSFMEKK